MHKSLFVRGKNIDYLLSQVYQKKSLHIKIRTIDENEKYLNIQDNSFLLNLHTRFYIFSLFSSQSFFENYKK